MKLRALTFGVLAVIALLVGCSGDDGQPSNAGLDVQGRGEAEPVAPNETGGEDNPEGGEQNRRVEVRYAG